MFISIIIPTLNEEECIQDLLQFLAEHPGRNRFEIIVVDGGSTDQTLKLVQSFGLDPVQTKIASRAHQMNEGAKRATGEVFYFVHADTQLVTSFVEDIHEAISSGVHSGCYRFRFLNPKNPLLHINGYFTRFPFKWCRGGDQTLFITREAFEEIGGFNERFVIMEDYDIIDRIEKNNISFGVLPKSVKVSARKYDRNSYMKVQLTNLKAMKMYRRGESPQLIWEFYYQALKGKYS
ncbi:TIGR04283 family arsenosugar biosynthesis glycosyltransferase [Ekhidna sp.]|uniref:TIGR04283 family arsenosugar biosynthesis glycosyltransferase n=1 Tax=Ekhidna sp. TaxID=2608089 RepID=UPI003B5AA65C